MANIVYYRNKCIGCGSCFEMMPGLWQMSKKDGKAILIKAILKKETAVLSVNISLVDKSKEIAQACPVKIIKVNE